MEVNGSSKRYIRVLLYITITPIQTNNLFDTLAANNNTFRWRLRGLAVACWTTDHYQQCSNLGVGRPEGCFVFDFVS